MSQKKNTNSGFTIIEVVLVLAIAALIFLIVFLALPQLQKSRRDTQRRNDTARIAAALETYSGSSNGNYPTNPTQLTAFINTFITGQGFDDPSSGNPYTNPSTVIDTGVSTANPATGEWQYYINSSCGDAGAAVNKAGARNISVRMGLEQGVYCVDNNN